MVTSEYTVYSDVVAHLLRTDWEIVCACPPVGTDLRFQKCNLARPGAARGVRDEIDITAIKAGVCLLVECKGTLTDSMSRVNRDGETDVDKLQRVVEMFPPTILATALAQAHGWQGQIDEVRTAVAYESTVLTAVGGVDAAISVHAGVVAWLTDDAGLDSRLADAPSSS
jgi:hypothetical protein